ncbi:MAG: metallophosphoesterase [Clostridia bacterium]|nr:metallophosphoesterase [Clostridia bacterium]
MVYRVGILILPLLFSLYGFINAATVTVTTYDLTVDKPLQPLKIVMISDLHLGAVGAESNLDDWVEAINQEEPDVVLIAGDLIDSDFDKIKYPLSAEKLLASIKARYGVYACLGNHDSGETYGKMLAFFERAEITVLRDSYQVIDDRFVLIGRYDISPIGSTYLDGKRQDTKAFLDSLHVYDLPTFVMDHNPKDVMAYDSRVDLVLSGHTHKGQVFPGNLVTDLLYPVDYGLHQQNEDSPYVVVSSGIFGWGMPMKTSGHSEIVVINIESSLTEQ